MTKEELINKTIEKFNNVNGLGTNGVSPIYGHEKSNSGIGCAIGCHLTAKMANELEEFCAEYDVYAISDLHDEVYYHPEAYNNDFVVIVNYMFDELFSGIDIDILSSIQYAHDSCVKFDYPVEKFIKDLKCTNLD